MIRKYANRCLMLLLSVCMILPLGVVASAASDVMPGDVDRDGRTTASDALLVLQQSVGLKENPFCTPTENFIADVNGDQSVDATDALLILQASVGMIGPAAAELKFESETIPLDARAAASGGAPELILDSSAWKQKVESLREHNDLTQQQADRLLERYDQAFFQDNALIAGVDVIASTADVTASRVWCTKQRILVVLSDAPQAQREAHAHLVLASLSGQEVRETGCFPKLDAVSVAFDRDGTIPRPDGVLTNYFYGPHDAFDYADFYVIDSRQELSEYAYHAYGMIPDEQLEESYLPGFREEYRNVLQPRNSEMFFEQYRTLIFEEHTYARASTRYVYRGLEDNADGTQTLVLELTDDAALPAPEGPADTVFDSFLTVRMTIIDLPADAEAPRITRVCNTAGEVLWEEVEA